MQSIQIEQTPGRCESRSPNGQWLARYVPPKRREDTLSGTVEIVGVGGEIFSRRFILSHPCWKNSTAPAVHNRRLFSFRWSPCGEHLAIMDHSVFVGNENVHIHLWRYCTRRGSLGMVLISQASNRMLQWSPDGSLLWTGTDMWCMQRNGYVSVRYETIYDITSVPRMIDWTSRDGSSFRMWSSFEIVWKHYRLDMTNGWYKMVGLRDMTMRGSALVRQRPSSSVALSPDGMFVAYLGKGDSVRIGDWRTGECLTVQNFVFDDPTGCVTFMFADNGRLQMYLYDHTNFVEMDLTPLRWLMCARAAATTTTTAVRAS